MSNPSGGTSAFRSLFALRRVSSVFPLGGTDFARVFATTGAPRGGFLETFLDRRLTVIGGRLVELGRWNQIGKDGI
jgi:hypothetical protein